jgi:hypothetical protein
MAGPMFTVPKAFVMHERFPKLPGNIEQVKIYN